MSEEDALEAQKEALSLVNVMENKKLPSYSHVFSCLENDYFYIVTALKVDKRPSLLSMEKHDH